MDGRDLKLTLVRHGITQRLLAEQSGIAYERLSKLVRGVARQRPQECRQLEEALGRLTAALAGSPAAKPRHRTPERDA